jgi:hypothetical protein
MDQINGGEVRLATVSTLNHEEIADDATRKAFVAGFDVARGSKPRTRAPKTYNAAEKFAFQSGKSHARLKSLKDSTAALDAFIALETIWAGSITASLRKKVEAGQVVTINA